TLVPEETKVRYPNGAAQGGWVGVSKHPAKPRVWMEMARPFPNLKSLHCGQRDRSPAEPDFYGELDCRRCGVCGRRPFPNWNHHGAGFDDAANCTGSARCRCVSFKLPRTAGSRDLGELI